MSEFQRRLAEKMKAERMTIEVEEYDRMKSEILVRKERNGKDAHQIIELEAKVKHLVEGDEKVLAFVKYMRENGDSDLRTIIWAIENPSNINPEEYEN